MCLILFAWKIKEGFPLILAANRDEFYERPTAPADFWDEAPDVLAGRDLKGGGSWFGITRKGKLAALTNYRDPATLKKDAPSRGRLVSDYLLGDERPEEYLDRVASAAKRYNGFSLVVGDQTELLYFSNRGEQLRLPPGIYGLSNRLLDTPWPKVERGKLALAKILERKGAPSEGALFALLADRSRPPDPTLPETGVGLERERMLSPLFIESPDYGTRSSTVLTMDSRGDMTFVERAFHGGGEPWMTSRFSFRIGQ